MCGRLDLNDTRIEINRVFNTKMELDFPARYNIAPTQPVLTVVDQPSGRDGVLMRWGLVPHWVKDPRDFTLLINARVETILEKPAFRSSIKNQRCVVPASGYYEWLRSGDEKQPFHISKSVGNMLALAGIYATWEGPDGEEIDSMAILTQEATGDLAKIHHRTPIHLDQEQMDLWLDNKRVTGKEALTLVEPLEKVGMKYYPVSKRVGNARFEGKELIKPVTLDSDPFEQKPKSAAPKKGGSQMDLF
jgi:putative SOS response-associated peptidase YedK